MSLKQDIDIGVDILDPIGFNNKGHVVNFMKYLFRTDTDQKWTNDQTQNCIVLYRSNKILKAEFFPVDLAERKILYEYFRKSVFSVIQNHSYKDLVNDIAYLDITSKTTDQNIQDAIDRKDLEDIAREVINFKPKPASRDILYVLHVDQTGQYHHLHTMGI